MLLMKSCYCDLPAAIRKAHCNERFIDTYAIEQLRQEIGRLKKIEGEWAMTKSEREELRLIGQGYTRKQVMHAR